MRGVCRVGVGVRWCQGGRRRCHMLPVPQAGQLPCASGTHVQHAGSGRSMGGGVSIGSNAGRYRCLDAAPHGRPDVLVGWPRPTKSREGTRVQK